MLTSVYFVPSLQILRLHRGLHPYLSDPERDTRVTAFPLDSSEEPDVYISRKLIQEIVSPFSQFVRSDPGYLALLLDPGGGGGGKRKPVTVRLVLS